MNDDRSNDNLEKPQLLFVALPVAIAIAFLFLSNAFGQVQLMAPGKLAAYRAALPAVEDSNYWKLFTDPATIFYTDNEIPAAYQFEGSFQSPKYNISGDPTDSGLPHGRGGNANVDFPWRTPGGLDAAENSTSSFKLLWLPKQDNGKPWPVVVWRDVLNDPLGNFQGLKWIFPVDTILGEALTMRCVDGQYHVFEVRIRMRQIDGWDVDILRPFPTQESLAEALTKIDKPTAARFVSRQSLRIQDLRGKHVNDPGFWVRTVTDTLPEIPGPTALRLLKETPFKSALGSVWTRLPDHTAGYAPTAEHENSIVPTGYSATFLGTDTVSCARCHVSTAKPARHFARFRGWYGLVRGSDRIFTFHPVDPSSISYSGFKTTPQLRQSFLQTGIVEWFDARKHPKDRYQQLAEGL